MTEKEKMQSQKLYDANYDSELERERIECKALCQEYNHLPIKEDGKKKSVNKKDPRENGRKIHIEPDFWCDYGYCISAGENFYANHGLVVLDAGGVSFGDNVFVAPIADSIHRDIRLISRGGIGVWNMHIQLSRK